MIRSSKIVILADIVLGATPKRTEIAIQYFRWFWRSIIFFFRDSHFYSFEPLCGKGLVLPLSHLARMRENTIFEGRIIEMIPSFFFAVFRRDIQDLR